MRTHDKGQGHGRYLPCPCPLLCGSYFSLKREDARRLAVPGIIMKKCIGKFSGSSCC